MTYCRTDQPVVVVFVGFVCKNSNAFFLYVDLISGRMNFYLRAVSSFIRTAATLSDLVLKPLVQGRAQI